MTADSVKSPPLLMALLYAPLGMVEGPDADVVHAATMEAISKAWPRDDDDPGGPVVSACGVEGSVLLFANGGVMLWPPYAKDERFTRCRVCHEATGRKRPSGDWRHRSLDKAATA